MIKIHGLNAVIKRELTAYFTTPLAYVFLAVFLLGVNAFTFYLGQLYEGGAASLEGFFLWHPWLYLFLLPALSMRLWAEEKRSGTIEVLMSLPVPLWQIVGGKFLAAWIFTAFALILTFPVWITVSYLGNPDHGLIVAGYWGSFMLAGAYLALGSFISALTRNQVIAFVLSVCACFVLTITGSPAVMGFFQGWLPQGMLGFLNGISFLAHFEDIQRGVISFQSLVYLGTHIGFWLAMCFLALGEYRHIFKSPNCICREINIVFGVILFIGLNLIGSSMPTLKLDMTAERLYTLSKGTKTLVRSIEEPVTLRFFYSREQTAGMRNLQSYAARIENTLRQYQALAPRYIDIDMIDPKPFSEEEDMAVDNLIKAVPLNEQGDKLYFGLSVSRQGSEKVESIRFLNPQREAFLEYDITKLIYDVLNPKKPKLGIISSFNMKTQDAVDLPPLPGVSQENWSIIHEIKHNFDVAFIDKDFDAPPEDLDAVMIAHPGEMSEQSLYVLDQFILGGGKALVFVDPYNESLSAKPSSSNLEPLLNRWGITMPAGQIVLDKSYGARAKVEGTKSRLKSTLAVDHLALAPALMERSSAITGSLNLLRMNSAGYFVLLDKTPDNAPDETPQWQVLLQSSDNSMSIAFDKERQSPEQLLEVFKADEDIYNLAGRLRGQALSAFNREPYQSRQGHISRSESDINVIVAADTDMLRDDLWLEVRNFYGSKLRTKTNDNPAFVINALEDLTGSDLLIDLRSRSKAERPFTVVAQLRQQAEEQFLSKEKRLLDRLQTIEASIKNTENTSEEITPEKLEERQRKFREEIIETRQELRRVQYELSKDIKSLGYKIKALNIALLPALILLLAFILPRRLLGLKRP